jgi:hypothetical protein
MTEYCNDEAGHRILTEPSKRALVINTIKATGVRGFVETGTYKGDMFAAVLPHVDRAWSCELHAENFKHCWKRFGWMTFDGKHLFHADSTTWLPMVLGHLVRVPAVIWLDAHYSDWDSAGSHDTCPLRAELQAIFAKPNRHVVLCDDARFLGRGNWPTLDEIKQIAAPREVVVEDDIVRIYP